MREKDPDSWGKALAFDAAIRAERFTRAGRGKISGELFVHRSFTPLKEAHLNDDDIGQEVMSFQDECDGICNV